VPTEMHAFYEFKLNPPTQAPPSTQTCSHTLLCKRMQRTGQNTTPHSTVLAAGSSYEVLLDNPHPLPHTHCPDPQPRPHDQTTTSRHVQ
jgi:hypothetical protein